MAVVVVARRGGAAAAAAVTAAAEESTVESTVDFNTSIGGKAAATASSFTMARMLFPTCRVTSLTCAPALVAKEL